MGTEWMKTGMMKRKTGMSKPSTSMVTLLNIIKRMKGIMTAGKTGTSMMVMMKKIMIVNGTHNQPNSGPINKYASMTCCCTEQRCCTEHFSSSA